MPSRFLCAAGLRVAAGLAVALWAGCDSNLSDVSQQPRRVTYTLTAQDNDSAIPEGVNATATFWEWRAEQTLVTLALEDGVPEGTAGFVAHIHTNSVSEGGGIAFFLAPIDAARGDGTSAKVVPRSYDELIAFDGHINLYGGGANALVAGGNIGANAGGQVGPGLELVDDPASVAYPLAAHPNDGSIPDGIAATAEFVELTPEQTLVQLQMDEGATGALLLHPAHIHHNTAEEGGDIAIALSPIDGNGNPANDGASSTLVNRSFDALTAFDGHINIHQSNSNLQYIMAQGNIGANSDGGPAAQ